MPTNVDYNALLNLALVIAVLVAALAALLLAVGVYRLARDLRSLARATERTLAVVDGELPHTLGDLRAAAANLRRLSDELRPRVERVDALIDEGEQTLLSLRATAEAAEEIVRGPAAAIERTRRTVKAAGEGLARGADRLIQRMEERSARRD
jgi:uncharacterized protein YoxC